MDNQATTPISTEPSPIASPTSQSQSHKKLFLIILAVILIAIVGVLTAYLIPNQTLLLSKLDARIHPSPIPKPGCFYKQVECFQAPCPPIEMCPKTSPIPTRGPTKNWKIF